MKTDPVFVGSTATFAALYAVGVIFLAPISFQIVQVRLADALLPLSILFGWPAIIGLTLGAFVANFYGGLGPIDIIGGATANFIATLLAWRVAGKMNRRRQVLGVIVQIISITLIVGSYLSYLFGMPLEAGWLGVLFGSVVAIGILGSLVLFAISSTPIAKTLVTRIARD